jgi:rhamnulose-1-phosphate aldolase
MTDNFFRQDNIREIIDDIARVAEILWQRGWAERNAGNISVNLTPSNIEHPDAGIQDTLFASSPEIPLETPVPDLDGDILAVTGTGTRMRDLARDPLPAICFVRVGTGGLSFQSYCKGNGRALLLPTSELPTHLAIQSLLKQGRSCFTTVLHAHATELIALTHLPQFTDEAALNELLFSMHPEISMFLPNGAGLVPFMTPGNETIAQATLKSFRDHDVVIWEKHGAMAIGGSPSEAFDAIDLVAKAAKIYLMMRR